jgi:hypothetical protein
MLRADLRPFEVMMLGIVRLRDRKDESRSRRLGLKEHALDAETFEA